MEVSLGQLLFRFLLGGTLVLVATLIADMSKSTLLTGIAATFPVVIISTALALFLSGYTPDFISHYFLGTLVGVGIITIFSLSGYYFVREYGFSLGLLISLLIWLSVAVAVAMAISLALLWSPWVKIKD
jgi:uncharacterized membrane protein (GlpM family)